MIIKLKGLECTLLCLACFKNFCLFPENVFPEVPDVINKQGVHHCPIEN